MEKKKNLSKIVFLIIFIFLLSLQAFAVDNFPPVTILEIGLPKYVNEYSTVYVSPSTTFTLTAIDLGEPSAGVGTTYYRIDNGREILYSKPFSLFCYPDGEHTISYYSVDNLGNREETKSLTLILDSTPPLTKLQIGSPKYSTDSNTWITSITPIEIEAVDTGVLPSGLKSIEYKIDNGSWLTYSNSFTLPEEGAHIINYRAFDNLGNSFSTSAWPYRIPIVIDNTLNPAAFTDYQLYVRLYDPFFPFAKANPDGSDLRFKDTDGITDLRYWIESYSPLQSGRNNIWVKVPFIPVQSAKTIYLYYGNPEATSKSNPFSVFDFYDDFNDDTYADGWRLISTSGPTITQHDGYLDIPYWLWGAQDLVSLDSFRACPILIETRMMTLAGYESQARIGLKNTQSILGFGNNGYEGRGFYLEDFIGGLGEKWTGVSTQNMWYHYRVLVDGNNFDGWCGWVYENWEQYIDFNFGNNYDFNTAGECSVSLDMWRSGMKIDWIRIRKYASPEPGHTLGTEQVLPVTLFVDNSAPVGSIFINEDAAYTNTTSVILHLTFKDTGCGFSQIAISNFSDFSIAETIALDTTSIDTFHPWVLTFGDGVKTVYARCFDQLANALIYSDTIVLQDITPPAGSVLINTGLIYTNTSTVILHLTAIDTLNNINTVVISNFADFSSSETIFFNSFEIDTVVFWTLLPEPGPKTVYVKYYDEVGNVSTVYSDTIFLIGIYQLTTEGGYGSLQWAPDGERFAAIHDTEGIAIFKLNEDKTSATKKGIIYNADFSGEFVWSPDGTKIAYQLIEYLNEEEGITGWTIMMAEVDTDGQVITQDILITSHGGGGHDITWSPDGTKLAFANETAVYTINITTKQTQLIITGREGEVFSSLAWMPDGKRIAYVRFPQGIINDGFLACVDIITGIEQRLSADNDIVDAIWYFSKYPGIPNKVYISGNEQVWMNEDGSNRMEGILKKDEVFGDWAPDGERFAYTYYETGYLYNLVDEEELNAEIGIMNTDGTGKQILTPGTRDLFEGGPKWSPKGDLILYWEEAGNIYLLKME